ncbi:MAG: pentapeptide repeat-containing protein, partial [Methanothrix sp.]|nr:pentapeptide repeat-containing protein [Methanothrix sp.]
AAFGRASFKEAVFQGKISLEGASFRDDASFEQTEYNGSFSFAKANFRAMVHFDRASFMASANFHAAIFQGDAIFCEAKFNQNAVFDQAQFAGEAHFGSVQFREDAFFIGTQFGKTVDFTRAEFQRTLILDGAKIDTMRLSDAVFSASISLRNANFSRIEVRWSSLKDHLIYDGATYLSLAKNFRTLEWFEDADDCYYCYRRKSQAGKRFYSREGWKIIFNWSKLLDALALISCGYGVRPRYTVFLSVFLIILFAFLYWTGNGIVVEPLNGSNPGIDLHENLSFPDNIYFSAMVFTAKTQVKWYPVGICRYLATAESVLGWLLLALFLVTLGRTMIR